MQNSNKKHALHLPRLYKKKDTEGMGPYFGVFKKVLGKKFKEERGTNGNEMEANDESDMKQSIVFNEGNINSCNIAQELHILRTVNDEATNKQTEATTNALKIQSQIIENLFASQQQKLEIYISSECESRLLESKLDKLLGKLEIHIIPQVT
ncbi:hypothetical protein RUM43_004213 [Polyplax serrata]|uniref:Uncharacterized protein n=1 Tax=Polyplax serrata TaxID=468196 RepID=A0AAN8SAM6_POLSC